MANNNEIIIKDLHADLVRMRNELHDMNKYLGILINHVGNIENEISIANENNKKYFVAAGIDMGNNAAFKKYNPEKDAKEAWDNNPWIFYGPEYTPPRVTKQVDDNKEESD